MRPSSSDPALEGFSGLIPAGVVARETLLVSPRTLPRWLKLCRLADGVPRTAPTGGRVLLFEEAVTKSPAQLEGRDI